MCVSRAYRPRQGSSDGFQREVFDVHMNSPTISARRLGVRRRLFPRQERVLAGGDPATVRKMIVAYCGYNFFSEACHLVEKARERALFSQEEASRLCADRRLAPIAAPPLLSRAALRLRSASPFSRPSTLGPGGPLGPIPLDRVSQRLKGTPDEHARVVGIAIEPKFREASPILLASSAGTF